MGTNGTAPLWQKLAYGAFFVLALPVLLVALATALQIGLPALYAPRTGAALLLAGVVIMLAGMDALARLGKGLPMNAFPPRRLVTQGVYAIFPHPIYCGFVMACAGVSLWAGSAAGLWVIAPLMALCCAALVWGHERPWLLGRHQRLASPLLGLTAADTFWQRAGMCAGVFVPWLVFFHAFKFAGAPPDAVTLFLPGETQWPVWTWTWPVYASAYVFPVVVFLAAPAAQVRRLYLRGWSSMVLMGVLYFCIPVVSPPRAFSGTDIFSTLLAAEVQRAAPFTAAFPSYHVVWSWLVASAAAARGGVQAALAWLWAALIFVSCITTGMHASVDIVAGIAVGFVLTRQEVIWRRALDAMQRLGNSLGSLQFGRLRILSHAPWSFAAGFVAMGLPVLLTQGQYNGLFMAYLLAGLAGAAVWGQWLEGTSRLQRPFGYFGALFAVVALTIALAVAGSAAVWPVAAALACAAPWVQAIGRLRCIVQGCCHGRPVLLPQRGQAIGIVVSHPRSRVVALSGLGGVCIYPAQMYSILGNIVAGAVLLRMWTLALPAGMICGFCLVFSALLRFVEEGYRGEAQTPHCLGLPVYQWLAVLVLCGGLMLLVVPLPAVAAAYAPAAWSAVLGPGLLAGALTTLCMSVDFPQSSRRFARLSG